MTGAGPRAFETVRAPEGWTPERVELLKTLWRDGLSAAQIAKQLGGVSREAVCGKANRIGLSRAIAARPMGRPLNPNSAAGKIRQFGIAGRGTVFEVAEPRPPRAAIPFRDEPAGLRTILTIAARGECKWPIGDPGSDDFTFCGTDAPEGRSYCHDHHKRSISVTQPAAKPRPYVAKSA